MLGDVTDVITHAKFHLNRFTSFGSPGGRKSPFPIGLENGSYNSDDWFIVQWSTTGCKGCTNNTNIHPNSPQKRKKYRYQMCLDSEHKQ